MFVWKLQINTAIVGLVPEEEIYFSEVKRQRKPRSCDVAAGSMGYRALVWKSNGSKLVQPAP